MHRCPGCRWSGSTSPPISAESTCATRGPRTAPDAGQAAEDADYRPRSPCTSSSPTTMQRPACRLTGVRVRWGGSSAVDNPGMTIQPGRTTLDVFTEPLKVQLETFLDEHRAALHACL